MASAPSSESAPYLTILIYSGAAILSVAILASIFCLCRCLLCGRRRSRKQSKGRKDVGRKFVPRQDPEARQGGDASGKSATRQPPEARQGEEFRDRSASQPPEAQQEGESTGNSDSQPPQVCKAFTYEELQHATNSFSPSNLLGGGGFGMVYKGTIAGNLVAVKQLIRGSRQGEREFRAEVDIISKVHHRHLVSLVGYCISDHHRLLVYNYVPNGTLEQALHRSGNRCMNWAARMNIALGTARGLAYLHSDCNPRIIHRDVKGSNILLDKWEAQVSDFGLAKLVDDFQSHMTTRVMGTFGYMAPEYAMTGRVTDKADVYSFGVVLLELITGKKPVDQTLLIAHGQESLVEWARPLLTRALETGNVDALVDPRLMNMYDREDMFRMVYVAATCVRQSYQMRPKMVDALRGLTRNHGDLDQGVLPGHSMVGLAARADMNMSRFRPLAFSGLTSPAISPSSSDNNDNFQEM